MDSPRTAGPPPHPEVLLRGLRHDFVGWTEVEKRFNFALAGQGVGSRESADRINARFHRGKPVRTASAVHLLRTKNGVKVAKTLRPRTQRLIDTPPERAKEQEVERTETKDGGVSLRALGQRIKTVADLLRYAEIDLTRFEVVKSSATAWDTTVRLPTGKTKTVQNFRVNVDVAPKAGPNTEELVAAMIAGAIRPRKVLPTPNRLDTDRDSLQALIITDAHVGAYAWKRETGHADYDIKIAARLLRELAAVLLADGNAAHVGERALWILGDFFHYDTPTGETTAGTRLDRDGRVEKMIEEGKAALFDIIEASAKVVPTSVVLVPGNHDAILTVTLKHILQEHFRLDRRVTVDMRGTPRKYIEWGKCLIGLTHGEKRWKEMDRIMGDEATEAWGRSTYREVHGGHTHADDELRTVGGVVLRKHRALCPPDGWHSNEGYVGAPRGMWSFTYHREHGLTNTRLAVPRE